MSKAFANHTAELAAQYPTYAGWDIEMMGTQIDQLTTMPRDVAERAETLHNDEGVFLADAIENALEESVIKCDAPDGYVFARISKAGETSVLVMLRTKVS